GRLIAVELAAGAERRGPGVDARRVAHHAAAEAEVPDARLALQTEAGVQLVEHAQLIALGYWDALAEHVGLESLLLSAAGLLAVRRGQGRRPQRRIDLGIDLRARHEQLLRQVHLEGDGPAADEDDADVLPVFLGRVLDDGPPLQRGLLVLVVEDEAVGGLPDGGLGDVSDLDLPLALTLQMHAHEPALVGPAG